MTKRILGLDGIRGIAAVSVVFCHCVAGSTQIGGYAVNLFFTLSGFLILKNLNDVRQKIDAHEAQIYKSLVKFWQRRIARIFPAYYVIAVTFLVMLVLTDKISVFYVIFYLTYTQNILLAVVNSWLPFSYSWTLAVEQQFYVMFAPIVLGIAASSHRLFLSIISVGLYILICGCLLVGVGAFVVFRLPFIGFMLAAVGGVVALSDSQGMIRYLLKPPVIATLVVLTILFSMLPSAYFLGKPTLSSLQIGFNVLALPLIVKYVASNPLSRSVRLLESPVFKFYGLISYSLYLIHGELVEAIKPHWFELENVRSSIAFVVERMSLFVMILSVSTLLGYLSFVFIEQPFLKQKNK